MSKTYDTIVTKAAEQLVDAMHLASRQGSYDRPTVYAIPTTEETDGLVVVVPANGPAPENGVLIMPNSNHASLHKSWYTTPYSDVRSILWQALRNQPILPRERPPTGPHVVTIRESSINSGRQEYSVLLNGERVGELFYAKGYRGRLPRHDGTHTEIIEWKYRDVGKEIVRINRAAKEAGRV